MLNDNDDTTTVVNPLADKNLSNNSNASLEAKHNPYGSWWDSDTAKELEAKKGRLSLIPLWMSNKLLF